MGHTSAKASRIDTILPAIERLLGAALASGDATANPLAWVQQFADGADQTNQAGAGAGAGAADFVGNAGAPPFGLATVAGGFGGFAPPAAAPASGFFAAAAAPAAASAPATNPLSPGAPPLFGTGGGMFGGGGAGAELFGETSMFAAQTGADLFGAGAATAGAGSFGAEPAGAGAGSAGPSAADIRARYDELSAKVLADFTNKEVKKALPKNVTKPIGWKSLLDLDTADAIAPKNQHIDLVIDAIAAAADKDAAANWFAAKLASVTQQSVYCGLKPAMYTEPKCWVAQQLIKLERAHPGFGEKFIAALFGNPTEDTTLGIASFLAMVPETAIPEPPLLYANGKEVHPKLESAMQMFGAVVRADHTAPGMPDIAAGFAFLERQLATVPPNGATTAASLTAFLTVAGSAMAASNPQRFQQAVARLPEYAAKIKSVGDSTAQENQITETARKCNALLVESFWSV